jgi:hypothetical protein
MGLVAPRSEARPGAASQSARVAIVFLPSPSTAIQGKPFIERVAAIDGITSFGFVSAIQGKYTPEQVLLDMSQGTRVQTGLYDPDDLPPSRLVPSGAGGRLTGWAQIAQRARTPPADIVPGTLGDAVAAAGLRVAYVGPGGARNREAIVAADRAGGVGRISLGDAASLDARARRAWRSAALMVVKLPGGGAGRQALRGVLAARRPQDLVLVMQDPNSLARRLLGAGAAGLAGGQDLRSASTRTDGLVITTDFAPTVLDRLGLPVPKVVGGEPIEARGSSSVKDLVRFRKRLAVVGPRRWGVVVGGLGLAIALVALVSLGRLRPIGRGALLAALWMPAVLLLTGAVAPSTGLLEILLMGGVSAALALITDRLLAWPRSMALPAGVTVGAHIVALVLGSGLIVRSLLGPNPLLGARFYGIGNELEVTLAVATLLGLGALFAASDTRTAVWGISVGGALVAFLLSWGRLGADVGAALTLGVGVAAAAVYAAGRGSWRSRAAIVLGAPALAIALLAGLDLATGGNAHFTRSVLKAGGLNELAQVAQRRFELSYSSLGRGAIGPLVVLAVAAVVLGIVYRDRLLSRVAGYPALRAGFWGAVVAVIGGALTNDSGPVIFLIGTVYLSLAVGYLQAMPNPDESPQRTPRERLRAHNHR